MKTFFVVFKSVPYLLNKKLAFLLFVLCWSVASYAQILTFEFNTGGSLTSNSNSANITSSTISYTTATLTSATTPPTSFTVSNWVNGVSLDTTEYFQFTITPVVNGSFNVTTMVFNYLRATNGPQSIAIRNSLDSYASNIATATVTNNGTTAQILTLNVNQTSSSSAVTYRIYGFNGAGNNTGSGGFSGTGNDIIVNGTATSSNFSGSAVISRSGRSSICLGDSSSIAFNITGGVTPYTVQTIDDLGLLRTFTGVRNNTPIYVFPQDSKTYTINSLTDSNGQALLSANFSGSAVVTVTASPVATAVGTYSRTLAHNDGLSLIYADGSLCKSWLRIQDALGGTILGSTTGGSIVYNTLPINTTSRYFLARQVSIAPTTQGNATITLYYPQDEFTSFNAAPNYQQKLPANSTDTSGILNKLKIYRSSSSIETDSLSVLTPSAVTWNATLLQWEVVVPINDGLLTGQYYLATPFGSSLMANNITHNSVTPVVGNTTASVTINWPDVVGATGYRFRFRPLGGSWNASTIAVSERTYNFLSFNTTYECQVRVIEGASQGEYTKTYTFTTPADPGRLPSCSLPNNITATVGNASSVTIQWASTLEAESYLVQIRPKNTLTWGGTSTTSTSKVFDGLSPATTYEFRIRTQCTAGSTETPTSAFSATDTFRTPNMLPCGTVQNLTADNITANSVNLQWTPLEFATSYQVQLRLKNAAVWGGTTKVSASHIFNNLSGNTTYEYRVRAFCNNTPALTTTTTGNFTTIAEFTTNAAQVLSNCLPPSNIVVTPSSTSLNITWDSAANANRYFVNLKRANSTTWGGTTVFGLSHTFNNLLPATSYHVRIRTVCTPGTTLNSTSSFSDSLFTTTTPLPNMFVSGTINTPITIYPNPTRNILQIDYSSESEEVIRVLVLDVTGRAVNTTLANPLIGQNNISLNMSMLQDGIYVIRIQQGNELRFVGQVSKVGQ